MVGQQPLELFMKVRLLPRQPIDFSQISNLVKNHRSAPSAEYSAKIIAWEK